MKRKFMSIFLCSMLILQPSAVPSFAVKTTHNYQRKTTKNSKIGGSNVSRVLKYLCPSAIFAFGAYVVYNHEKDLPEKTENSEETPDNRTKSDTNSPHNETNKTSDKPTDIVHTHRAASLKEIKDFEEFLDDCLKNDITIPQEEIIKTCDEAIELLKKEPTLLKLSGSTIIVGDTHSDLGAVEYSIRKFLKEAQNGKSILFLGDYVDRGDGAPGGPNGVKNMYLLLKLKSKFPDMVHLLRGNHEEFSMGEAYGFLDECNKLYGNERSVYEKFNTTFNYLSLAAVIDNSTFCVHGGIASQLKKVEQINEIHKPLSSYSLNSYSGSPNYLAIELLWNDPKPGKKDKISGFEESDRGDNMYLFNYAAAKSFLNKNKLKRIIRAHQAVNGHECTFGDQSLITIFSAPNYCGGRNLGEMIDINGNEIKYEKIDYSKNKIVKGS